MIVPALQWLDGVSGAALPLTDRGLHYGDGFFETMAVRAGNIAFLGLHVERARQTAQRLGFPRDIGEDLQRECIAAATQLADGMLKAIVTRGDGQRGYAPRTAVSARRVLLGYPERVEPPTTPLTLWPCQLRLGPQPLLAGLKTLNRLEHVLATQEWQRRCSAAGLESGEGLLSDGDQWLIGGTRSNLFWRQGGVLCTPRLDRAGIDGILRRVVLREAHAMGLAWQESRATLADLALADEIFMTNVRWRIRPVSQLNSLDGGVTRQWPVRGALTKALQTRIEGLRS